MNTNIGNQATHCLIAIANDPYLKDVTETNTVLQSAFCPTIHSVVAGFFGLSSKPKSVVSGKDFA
jgi:hypothetical protein